MRTGVPGRLGGMIRELFVAERNAFLGFVSRRSAANQYAQAFTLAGPMLPRASFSSATKILFIPGEQRPQKHGLLNRFQHSRDLRPSERRQLRMM